MRRCKKSICFVFGISLFILVGSLWWLQTKTVKESFGVFDNAWARKATLEIGVPVAGYLHRNTQYINFGDEQHMRAQANNMSYLELVKDPSPVEKIQLATFNPSVFQNDQSIFVTNPRVTGVSSSTTGDADYSLDEITTDLMNNNPNQKIKWDDVRIDYTKKNTISIAPKIKKPIIMSDACSKKSMLNSEFKEDICEVYAGDNPTINAKCQELSEENCKIPSCCVLVNGTRCVVGDQNGPIFTDGDADYKYYYNKNKCYGNCEEGENFMSACAQYSNNSTGVSKECMVQMFNNYGCPNKTPDIIINDGMVRDFSKTTKQYVDDYIKIMATTLKAANDKYICYGSSEEKTGAGETPIIKPAESIKDVGSVLNSTMDSLSPF